MLTNVLLPVAITMMVFKPNIDFISEKEISAQRFVDLLFLRRN
jgi:hypothetical protein